MKINSFAFDIRARCSDAVAMTKQGADSGYHGNGDRVSQRNLIFSLYSITQIRAAQFGH